MRKYLFMFIPLLLALVINPIVLLTFLLPSAEKPDDAEVFVNGEKSGLKVRPGDRLSMKVTYTLTEYGNFSIELCEGSVLKIDGQEVRGKEITLKPGKHYISFESEIKEAVYPEKRILLSINPVTKTERLSGIKLSALVLPPNFSWFQEILLIGTIVEIVLSGLTIPFCDFLRKRIDEEMGKEKRRLENEIRRYEEEISNLKGKTRSFFILTTDFLEENGMLAEFHEYLRQNLPRIVIEDSRRTSEEGEEGKVRIKRRD